MNVFHRLIRNIFEPELLRKMKERGKTVPVHPGEIRAVDDLATSRVVIPRLLKKLENEGRILLYRHEIKIPNEL